MRDRPRHHRSAPSPGRRAGRRRAGVPRAGRAVPPRARGALLPDARLRARRRGHRPGDAAAGVARARALRAARVSFRPGCTGSRPTRAWTSSSAGRGGPSRSTRSRTRRSDEAASPTMTRRLAMRMREGMELALLRAIQELPGRQRAVLIFRDVLGWTAPEVAELLESTVASVNSALQRARATIDRQLPDATRRGRDPAERELLEPLCRRVRARRHGRARRAAARGRELQDAAAAVADRRPPDRALLPRDRRPTATCRGSG